MTRCQSRPLHYTADEHGHPWLDHIGTCPEPGVTVRTVGKGTRATETVFCQHHADRHDAFTARLKTTILRLWEERGEQFMSERGHVRPVLTPEELAQLTFEEIS